MGDQQAIRGRGSSDNPANRFDTHHMEYELDVEKGTRPAPDTRYLSDDSDQIIAHNDSPDIPFDSSINPYRGCEHGCIYCYARPTHEYLGFSAGLDFESRIMIKYDAPELLRRQLSSDKWQPKTLVMSGVTDPYQPIEKEKELTRGCLKVLAEFMNPVGMITKNHLCTRDIDVMQELAEHKCIRINLSITTLDRDLANKMEPRTSQPYRRLEAVRKLSEAGISVGVMVAPIIPGLTDHECVSILEAAADAGAQHAGYTILRLPGPVKNLFQDWLEHHIPDRAQKVLNRIKNMRNGKLNDPRFGHRMGGEGEFANQISSLFKTHAHRLGLDRPQQPLTTRHFRPGRGSQLKLF